MGNIGGRLNNLLRGNAQDNNQQELDEQSLWWKERFLVWAGMVIDGLMLTSLEILSEMVTNHQAMVGVLGGYCCLFVLWWVAIMMPQHGVFVAKLEVIAGLVRLGMVIIFFIIRNMDQFLVKKVCKQKFKENMIVFSIRFLMTAAMKFLGLCIALTVMKKFQNLQQRGRAPVGA